MGPACAWIGFISCICCLHICTYMCVCLHAYITHRYMYIYIYAHIYIYTHKCLEIYLSRNLLTLPKNHSLRCFLRSVEVGEYVFQYGPTYYLCVPVCVCVCVSACVSIVLSNLNSIPKSTCSVVCLTLAYALQDFAAGVARVRSNQSSERA